MYFDISRSSTGGRRLPKSKCIRNPTYQHLLLACEGIGIPFAVELDKRHPKDSLLCGRVRVKVYDDEHQPVNPAIKNMHDLLRLIGERLPEIVNRLTANEKETSKSAPPSSSIASVNEAPGVTLVPRIKKKSKKK